MDNFFKRN